MKAFNEKIILRNVAIDPSGGGKDLIAAINTPVTVYQTGTTNLADIFDLDENPISNPTSTDIKGNVAFKVANGVYDIVGGTGENETRWDEVEIIDLNTTGLDKTYATVADMKADTSLQANDSKLINTVDYYSTQRGGGASYLIKTVAQAAADGDVVDNLIHHSINGGLYVAVYQTTNAEIDILQAGGVADGVTDDRPSWMAMINRGFKNITGGDGDYFLDTVVTTVVSNNPALTESAIGIQIKNRIGITINLGDRARFTIGDQTLKATSVEGLYRILSIENSLDINIKGGQFFGDRDIHTGTFGEFGHGIFNQNSRSNIIDADISKCWGDGLVWAVNDIYTKGGTITKVSTSDNRRQGLSIISCNGLIVTDFKPSNISGTAPSAGIDVEPDTSGEYIKGLVIDGLSVEDCDGVALEINLSKLDETSDDVDITVGTMTSRNNAKSLVINSQKANGIISIDKVVNFSSKENSLQSLDVGSIGVEIDTFIDLESNTDMSAGDLAQSNFYVQRNKEFADIKNIHINNCIVYQPNTEFLCYFTNGFDSEPLGLDIDDLKIIATNPELVRYVSNSGRDSVNVSSGYKFNYETTQPLSIPPLDNRIADRYVSRNVTGIPIWTVDTAEFQNGKELTFACDSVGDVRVIFPQKIDGEREVRISRGTEFVAKLQGGTWTLKEVLFGVAKMYTASDGVRYISPRSKSGGGTTGSAPFEPLMWENYYDVTLGQLVVWNGSVWIQANTL